ncbi:MAG: hypothetical protein R3345_09305 [Fulvivirga sp.]|nr:hypothetical protein [Fulvivirga sp.]
MASANPKLILVLRNTIQTLGKSDQYQWGHMGSCNCGFLAQEISRLSKKQIHERAMQKYGDWNDQLNEYCPTSGLLMDDLITDMLAIGFDTNDLKHLEKLSDKNVIKYLPDSKKNLRHNYKADVIAYLKAWVAMLEDQLIDKISIAEVADSKHSVAG